MPLTYKQIYDLDNSMVAAQQVLLGQVVSFLSGSLTVSASLLPAAAETNVEVAGIGTVSLATVVFSGSVNPTHNYTTVTYGNSTSAIKVFAWKVSGSSLVAASTPFTKVVWTAYGK